jgi:hypothetical protein
VSAYGRKGRDRFRRAAPRAHGCWERGDGEAASALATYGRWRESRWLRSDGLLNLVREEYWPAMYAAEEALRRIWDSVAATLHAFVEIKDAHLEDSKTRKLPNINTGAAHIVVLHPFKDRLSRSHS